MTTSTQHSNLPLEEIFSDNYTTGGLRLLSQSQNKLLSQNKLSSKDKNEKQK